MNLDLLEDATTEIKETLEDCIRNSSYGGRSYNDGRAAKTALIRSSTLIDRIHEVVKSSLCSELDKRGLQHTVYPPLGSSSPELKICGLLKGKRQDVTILMGDDSPSPEEIEEGPLAGTQDPVGLSQSERSIVVGVRSQLSSVAKNFDTLMERAFAETLNLRLRLPRLVMGEVYMLPVVEYDDTVMTSNEVRFCRGFVPVRRFIETFLAISDRDPHDTDEELYKYERSALILLDFRESPVRSFLTLDDLQQAGIVPDGYERRFSRLSPRGFASDLIDAYVARHGA